MKIPSLGFSFIKTGVLFLKAKIGATRYLYIVAGLIGLCAGLAATILKSSVHGAEELARYLTGKTGSSWLLSLFPLVGIGLSYAWVKFFIKDDIGHGITRVMEVIATPKSRIKPHNMYSSLVGCTLTAGFGGSVGMEGPIVATGAALGDNIASLSNADYKRRMILIGCGAAGAIAAIFKAPIAGLVFCIEVFALDVASSSVISLLISSAVACLFSMIASGYQVEFHFTVHEHFSPLNAPFYVMLGVFSALVSVYFMRASRFVEGRLKKLPPGLIRLVVGAVLLGVFILFFPPLYGEGYSAMRSMLTNNMAELFTHSIFFGLSGKQALMPLLLIAIVLIKPLATASTTASGGVGGIFAPTLFVGCAAGYAFAAFCNLLGIAHLPEMNFALAGMAGALSGVMHAPLTGIFLIAELTGGYELFVPLIIVSSLSTAITRHFEPHSIYTRPLYLSGKLITHHKDQAILTLLQMHDFLENDRPGIQSNVTIAELAKIITAAPRDYYPVRDQAGAFIGFIESKDILPVLANPELRDYFILADLVRAPRCHLGVDMRMVDILEAFEDSDEPELPVFDGERLLGFISRAKIYSAYREKLAEISEGDEA
jgi:chloride channel protein, CIC family